MDEDSPPKRPLRPGVRKTKYWSQLIKDTLMETEVSHIIHGRLDPHQIFESQDEIKEFYSGHDIHPSRIIDNENFARWVIGEALEGYQPDSSFQVTGNIMQGKSVTMSKESILKEISDAIQADGQQDIDAEGLNGFKEADSDIVQDVSAATESIIAASPNSLGPPIEPCASYLRMEKCGTFGRNNLTVWKSPFFPHLDGQEGRKGFLDNQITAIVWIMANFLGELPWLKPKFPEFWNKETRTYEFPGETKEARKDRKRLHRPRYFGAILADSMGMGKTFTTIACLDIMASHHLNVVKVDERNFKHCPMLVLAPNLIVASQWVEEIEQVTNVRSIKKIILSGDGARATETQRRTRVLTAKEFREWPPDLNYVWDEDDPAASRVIIVMSIDTWGSRTCTNQVLDENGQIKEGDWRSSFTELGRRFSIVVVDEAYKIRHTTTRCWKSVALLERQFTLLITATPCMNLLTDLLGPVRLLWPKAEKYLQENASRWDRMDKRFEEPEDLEALDDMEPHDDHQLIAGRPGIMAKLVNKYKAQNVVDIQETRMHLKYFERLAILRRAPSSNLHWDWKGSKLVCLDGLLPNVYNFTVNIQLDRALEEAYQGAHIDLLINYMGVLKKIGKQRVKSQKKKSKEVDQKLHFITTLYHKFQLAAASMDIFRLEKLFSLNGFGINAEHVQCMRNTNVNFLRLAPFLLEPHDTKPKTALDHVRLAIRKSPVLRYILQHVKEYVLDRKPGETIRKLLIIESRPVLAYYYELVLQFLLINCRTLHAGLSGERRRELIASFNDSDDHSCQILIQMYAVGFAGSNLHKNCARVLVATQAHSFPVQMQAVHRVIRVGQTKDVEVYRLKVNNSYHQFRESQQVEKILPELGTRAQGSMVDVLVQLLNLFQFEIDEAANSPEAKELMDTMNLLVNQGEVVGNDDGNSNQQEEEAEEDGWSEEDDDDDEEEEPPEKRVRRENDPLSETGKHDEGSLEPEADESDSHDDDLTTLRNEGTAYLFGGDYDQFLRLKPRTAYYKEFRGFPSEVRSHFSHQKNNLRRLLSYSSPDGSATTRVWTAKDLNKSAVLERAMELTLRVRLGANNIEMLPSPQIHFTFVPERKLQILTKLLGQAKYTAQDIDELIQKNKEARARKGDSKGELRAIHEHMTLEEIDESFQNDITKGDTKQSRKRKRQEAEEPATAANDEAPDGGQDNEVEDDGRFWDDSDNEVWNPNEDEDEEEDEDGGIEGDGEEVPEE
ncbi:SNF2 family N-terminal domain-containing protein [Annulohypoxylon truncatum]|uniref:SNF2 family N-terminal domain-containing protein n=1 Tax=Annulohypoxylon truncatum TaxID=327061 RepID=UPI0020074701|nr:SNF2 family N-terminal domain-containing protein [Annulohypoxylon truncatum]KAI1211585.1 SNF2 family N-terminal domain-containing protein [Annulohypoxylon truncatum]